MSFGNIQISINNVTKNNNVTLVMMMLEDWLYLSCLIHFLYAVALLYHRPTHNVALLLYIPNEAALPHSEP